MRGNQETSSMILDVADRNEMKQNTVIGVSMRHFDAAFNKIKPSVSEKVSLFFVCMKFSKTNQMNKYCCFSPLIYHSSCEFRMHTCIQA